MTDKELRKLKRAELLEILYYLQKEIDSLKHENAELKERIENGGSFSEEFTQKLEQTVRKAVGDYFSHQSDSLGDEEKDKEQHSDSADDEEKDKEQQSDSADDEEKDEGQQLDSADDEEKDKEQQSDSADDKEKDEEQQSDSEDKVGEQQ